MSAPTTQLTSNRESEYGSDIDIQSIATLSDYGSDIDIDDDTILADAFDSIAAASSQTQKSAVLPSVEFEEGEREDEEQDVDGFVQIHRPTVLRVTRSKANINTAAQGHVQSSPVQQRKALEVEYDERSRRAWSVPYEQSASPPTAPSQFQTTKCSSASQATAAAAAFATTITTAVQAAEADTRPPLERFRTKPKKCLSVTDLVSPAWCELQYFYTLSKFGRKPRTAAMKTGSKIHQTLEDQVHTTVPVQVESKEDRFGLRMWNAISGLRCLRETGLTRELEVWGVIEGQVINGVIDEISYLCPNEEFEEEVERERAEKNGGIMPIPLPPNQPSIEDAFAKAAGNPSSSSSSSSTPVIQETTKPSSDRQVYIADVKTRSAKSLPTGASLRPTWMQLMLYRKLLEPLSLNTVDAETVLQRYSLDPLAPFSPTFLGEIQGIGPHGNPESEATNYPNLLSLWSLLVTEMYTTFPPGSLSPILRAEFRYSKTGDVLGSQLVMYEAEKIDEYVESEMGWWKGRREARGVEIEEAFKCRICDFAEVCTWRRTKVEEAVEKSRLRREGKGKAVV
ncbi:exonuclease V [Alternaria panax]|uniref:Exonuclease V n=1 Tax=Alternaria panax TaxID=48097 RepID=A0AAD4I8F2_9PLEO|nr:exonuclease V [Alternaria panax]